MKFVGGQDVKEERRFVAAVVHDPQFIVCTNIRNDVNRILRAAEREIHGFIDVHREHQFGEHHGGIGHIVVSLQRQFACIGANRRSININLDAHINDIGGLQPGGLSVDHGRHAQHV